MAVEKKALFNGNRGTVMVGGLPAIYCTKGSIIEKTDWEEIPASIGPGKQRVKVGETIEVSFTFKATGEEDLMKLRDDDLEIVMNDVNVSGTYLKSVKARGVTLDEIPLINFEKNKVQEIELSGQAEEYIELL